MNRQVAIGVVVGAVAATAVGALAGYRVLGVPDQAEVLAVRPAMKTVSVPRQECHDEAVTRQRPVQDTHQVAGTVTGAVVGGLLGSQIGAGSGRTLATVGGAVAGGYAGNKVQADMQQRDTYQEVRQVCRSVTDRRQQPDGFEVTYRLDGRESTIHLDYDPGTRIPVENGELVLRR